MWREQIGVSEDGWVGNEQYEDAVRKVAELKESLVAVAEGDQEDIGLLERGGHSGIMKRLIDNLNYPSHSIYQDSGFLSCFPLIDLTNAVQSIRNKSFHPDFHYIISLTR